MRILFVYSDPNCSCTVKNIFELSEGFRQIGSDISIEYYLKIEEEHFKNFDVIMMHRFGGNAAIIDDAYVEKIQFLIKKYVGKVLTVYHIDDLLLNETIKNFIKMVDLVLVPNENYVPYYDSYNKNFAFINQTFIDPKKFDEVPDMPSITMNPRKFNILWASTGLVGKSFMRKLIPELEKKFGDSIMLFILGNGSLEFKGKNIKSYSNLPFDSFVNFLKKSDLCINPISLDTKKFRNVKTEDFINCKSEIKYCSAAICKLPIISGKSYSYSKTILPDYNGVILDNDVNLWVEAISKIKEDKNYRDFIIKNAYDDCIKNFTIINASKVIKKIFEKNYVKITSEEYTKSRSLFSISSLNGKKSLILDQYQIIGDSVLGEISSHRKINQEFIVRNENLCKIQFRVATYGRKNKGFWKISIMTRFGDLYSSIRSTEIDTSNLIDGDWLTINFDPIVDSKNKRFYIQIQGLNCPLGNSATLYYNPNDISLGGFLYLNKSKISGNICLKTYCKLEQD
jgi:glycosyltransferase involved in cell wall biosynthesis